MVFESAKLQPESPFCALVDKAGQGKISGLSYAGEVSPEEAFDYISVNPSILVDVRTVPEWQFTGMPNLAGTPSKLLTVSWKIYPSFAQNPKFIEELTSDSSVHIDTPLFFICRSGGRSLDAAVAMTKVGHRYCFNVTGGFEGDADEIGHRSKKSGWKYNNLPWMQG
ncbi:MAG: rhodanese-like domain-containing protein [Pseudomonadota bacterium]